MYVVGELFGLDRARAGQVEVTAPRGKRRGRLAHGTVHTTTTVGPHDVVTRAGFPCSSPTRTNLDLAAADFVSERGALVVEVTGRVGHSSPRERQLDAQRRNELADLGFRVTEHTWEDLPDRPDYVVGTMRARLRNLHVA